MLAEAHTRVHIAGYAWPVRVSSGSQGEDGEESQDLDIDPHH